MSLKIPAIILKTPILYRIGRFCYGQLFFNMGRGRFHGVFDSLDEAKKCIGPGRPTSYSETDLSDVNVDSFMQIHSFDHPVITHLRMRKNHIKSLIDYGGHIGVKYYAYNKILPDIRELKWTVVDVPFCVERGRTEASQRGVANLSFSSDIREAGACDLLLLSGALQYVEPSIGELLDSMIRLPRFIIINKLPVHRGPDCCTIENFGKAKIPYRIFNKDNLDAQLLQRVYRRSDSWTIPSRDITIPFCEDKLDRFVMEGHVWEMTKNP